jgi:MFS family permease
MSVLTGTLYRYIGVHSFLIGLFPFYIPVYLWKTGYSLSEISFFISITGAGFCMTLWGWDRIHKIISLRKVITLSFGLEIILLATIFLREVDFFFPLFAIINGAYSCFFWTTQRVLFLDTVVPSTSGRKFGNLQIIVALLLKSGIFLGGLILDLYGFQIVFIFSFLVAFSAAISFGLSRRVVQFSTTLLAENPVGLRDIVFFKDHFGSKLVFAIDGLFLFLESYFWMISLFLIVKESFLGLGILIIAMLALFTILFWLIKNSIDRLPPSITYKATVLFYAVSWILRGKINEDLEKASMLFLLVFITFFTSLFRLTFNKRFFDLAKKSSSHRYLLIKSYTSQAAIVVMFGIFGYLLMDAVNSAALISKVYTAFALIAGIYLIYGQKDQKRIPENPPEQRL